MVPTLQSGISIDCRKSPKFGSSIYFGQKRTELKKGVFQCNALDILRDIRQITD